MYVSLQSPNLDFDILVLNLICLVVLYVPRESPFISTQLFVLNLDENSELKAFKNIKFLGEISNNWLNVLFGENVYKTLKSYSSLPELKFDIILCYNLNLKCNSNFYFLYPHPYWMIISQFFMLFDKILKIILNIWHRTWKSDNSNLSLYLIF